MNLFRLKSLACSLARCLDRAFCASPKSEPEITHQLVRTAPTSTSTSITGWKVYQSPQEKDRRSRLWFRLALACELLRDQKAPHDFVRVQILAGLADRFLHFKLLSARPGISRAFYAVKNHRSILLAAGVGIDSGFHAALLAGRQLALLRLFLAAVNLPPGLSAIFHRDDRQAQVVLRAAPVRNDRVRGTVDHYQGHRARRQTNHGLRHRRAHCSNRCNSITQGTSQTQAHEAAFGQACRVNS